MGLPRPPGSPITLSATGLVAYLGRGQRQRVRPLVQAWLLERIPSPITVARDLGKRRSAQRLALDT
jgi:hypothetical protein